MPALPARLLDDAALEASSVVAHRFMNRDRVLRGGNGYARELGLDPVDFLRERLEDRDRVGWLDLCCGSGRALVDAAGILAADGLGDRVRIRGIDLVDAFAPSPDPRVLDLVATSLHRYATFERFDLVTCVHGLHYVGDKLRLVARACRWLLDDGVFVATFDLGTVQLADGDARRQVPRVLRDQGVDVDVRRHRLRCDGRKDVEIPWDYLGADDRAGPGFTGERAVASWYRATT